MEAILEKPSLQDQRVASASLPYFDAFHKRGLKKGGDLVELRLQEHDEAVTIPRKALELLKFILLSMAEGKAVSLIPSDSELSTQQAADMLNVSRPHLVKLLEQGAIPFKKVGSHRRVQLEHLLSYEQQQAQQQRQHLQFLVQQAQELNLGYQ
ncbi:helix-turn-helix domain-containing protein [Hymenobacter sp. BT664]|uniref:Helix-turn-helix domain-containing protein n=1 Tax=Hymenobacter montanus TaxID=2771359 RepID=A0A927GKP9_9BACT|nr:excisionase family DNA-binding protein [Hymenobacter montanus]MBD2769823.1 helix-turn-helix domain-containing protein [Hymenobacter montanus]